MERGEGIGRSGVLNPRHVRAFLTVSEVGSVIRGAQVPHRARSASKRTVKEFEKDLGVVMQSDTATAVFEHQINRQLESAALRVLPIALPDTSRPTGIMLRDGGIPPRAAQRLVDTLREIGPLM
jgi:DNA-binding transcriptional LysR family regulator